MSVYFGNNPLNNSPRQSISYVSIFPEGWAFFTKSAKEPRIHIYNCNNNKIEYVDIRNFSKEYYFGISRHNRILNIEMGNILEKIKMEKINSFVIMSNNEKELNKKLNPSKIKYSNIYVSSTGNKDFKGKYLLSVQYLLPWPLLKQKQNYPSKFVIYPINIIENE